MPRETQSVADDASRHVLAAAAQGWRLFPIPLCKKKPEVKWKEWATCDPERLRDELRRNPHSNWGLATGQGSGIFVVDSDSDAGLVALKNLGPLPPTRTVKTGRKTGEGRQLYFRYPNHGAEIRNSVKMLCVDVDVRGDGGYVVIPPSIHPSGLPYDVLDDSPVADAPDWLLEKLTTRSRCDSRPATAEVLRTKTKIPEGSRNSALASHAGALRRIGCPLPVIEAALLAKNKGCDPPLDESEVLAIARSVSRYEPDESQADELIVNRDLEPEQVTKLGHILRNGSPELFRHDRSAVWVVEDAQRRTHMVEAGYYDVIDAAEQSGKVLRCDKNDIKQPTNLHERIAKIFQSRLNRRGTPLREVRTIRNAPLLLPDNSIATESRYYPETCTWLDTRSTVYVDPLGKDRPWTQEECREAFRRWLDPSFESRVVRTQKVGFRFDDRDHPEGLHTPSFSVVRAALLAIADRPNQRTVPIFCISAPLSGGGKTLLAQTIITLMTGRKISPTTFKDSEAFSKQLPGLLKKLLPVILMDNIKDGQPLTAGTDGILAIAITQDDCGVEYRPFHTNDSLIIENHSVFIATGIQLEVSEDMLRRCLLTFFAPDCEHPDREQYTFMPTARARELHPAALMTALKVIQAHEHAGAPGEKMLSEASGFPDFDRRARAPILWLGYPDPLISRDAIRDNDSGLAVEEQVMKLLKDVREDEGGGWFVCDLPSRMDEGHLKRLQQLTGHKPFDPFDEMKVSRYFIKLMKWSGNRRLVHVRRLDGKWKWRIEVKQQETTREEEEPL